MNSVKSIQPNYIYRVNPVNLFENKNRQNSDKISSQDGKFNLNHPKNPQGNRLDFLA